MIKKLTTVALVGIGILLGVTHADAAAPNETQFTVGTLNNHRATVGAQALNVDAGLTRVAQAKAEDMANRNYFSHVNPDGNYVWNTLYQWGHNYAAVGENMGMKTFDPRDSILQIGDLYNMQMASPPHHAIIDEKQFNKVGVGTAMKDGRFYWVTVFGR